MALTEREEAMLQPRTRAVQSDQPVIVFDEVSLAFDEKVILDRVSFELLAGRTKIILGGSGVGKSTVLKLILAVNECPERARAAEPVGDVGGIAARGAELDGP